MKLKLPKLNWTRATVASVVAFGLMGSTPHVLGQDREDMEWEPGTGVHEEEWYDPSDWFDGDEGINREETYGYDSSYHDRDYWEEDYQSPQTTGTDWSSWENSPEQARSTAVLYIWVPSEGNWAQNTQNRQSSNTDATRNEQQQPRSQRSPARSDQRQARSEESEDRRSKQARQQKTDREQKEVQLAGTIDGFKQIRMQRLSKQQEDHTFIRVRLENDDAAVVDLGPSRTVESLDLNNGEEIKVRGGMKKLQDRKVVVASMIQSGDEKTKFRWNDQKQDSMTASGQVAEARKMQMDGTRADHLLVRLELEKGKEIIVDFGPETTMSDLGLEEGDQIKVTGQTASIDGKSILLARNVRIDGTRKMNKANKDNQEG